MSLFHSLAGCFVRVCQYIPPKGRLPREGPCSKSSGPLGRQTGSRLGDFREAPQLRAVAHRDVRCAGLTWELVWLRAPLRFHRGHSGQVLFVRRSVSVSEQRDSTGRSRTAASCVAASSSSNPTEGLGRAPVLEKGRLIAFRRLSKRGDTPAAGSGR